MRAAVEAIAQVGRAALATVLLAVAHAAMILANRAVLAAVDLAAISAISCAVTDACNAARIRAYAQTMRPAIDLALGPAVACGLAHTNADKAAAVSAAFPRNIAALAGETALADALVAASDLAVFSAINFAALAPIAFVLADARAGLA